MDHIETGHLNNDFRTTLHRLMESGLTAHPRGTTTKEHLNYNISLFDPRNRIVNFADRKTSLKYLLGEFIWYCTGSDNPEGILPYAKFWDGIRNSGDEIGYERGTINSNYGTRLFGHSSLPAFTKRTDSYDGVEAIDQWQSTIDMLKADKDSRQAIMNIHAVHSDPTLVHSRGQAAPDREHALERRDPRVHERRVPVHDAPRSDVCFTS
jgi:thymidylate synthase